jgi:putative MATE family efflux protein
VPLAPPLAHPETRTTSREVIALAGPAVLSSAVQIGYGWINQAWVGRLEGPGGGTTATAAIAVGGLMLWALQAISTLVATGASAVVGRYVGAGREPGARYVASQAVRWSIVVGLVTGAIVVAAARLPFTQTNVSADATAIGTAYTRIAWAGAFAATGQSCCDAIWRGHGNTRTPLLTSVVGLGLNAALDPLLIFGWGPVPALGVPGAAIATVVASTVAFLWSARLLKGAGHLVSARPSDDVLRLDETTLVDAGPPRRLDLAVGRRLVRVGLPVAATGVFFVLVYVFLSRVVTDAGFHAGGEAGRDAAQAGLWVGLRGEQISYILGVGFQVAAASLVARRLGAGRPEDASRAAWRANWIASVGCLLWSAALLLLPETLANLFLPASADNAAARAHAIEYWRVVALCLVPQCWEVVLEGGFAGAGMTVPPMIVTMVLTALRVPLARWASTEGGYGLTGIWVVIAATAAVRGIVIAAWFALGTWKKRTV